MKEKKGFTKLDPYELNKPYALTINPNDKHQGLLCSKYRGRLALVRKYIMDIISDYKIPLLLHLDISQPSEINKNIPRIHYHGVVLFRTNEHIMQFQLELLRQLSSISYIKIKPIDDIKLWSEYCQKYDRITNIQAINNYLTWSEIGGKSSQEGAPYPPLPSSDPLAPDNIYKYLNVKEHDDV